MISAGWPAVAANAAANAIVAIAPIAPSYWLPTTTGTLRARHRSRIRRDSVKPVRAVLMLTTRTAPSSSARSTCARLMQLSSPPSGTAQRSASRSRPARSSTEIGSSITRTPSSTSASPARTASS